MPHAVVFLDMKLYSLVGECQRFSTYDVSSFRVAPNLLLLCSAVNQKAIIQQPSLFMGVTLLKHFKNRKGMMCEFNTLWEKWG